MGPMSEPSFDSSLRFTSFSMLKRGIFCKVEEVKDLCGVVHEEYVAQGSPKTDKEIAEKGRFSAKMRSHVPKSIHIRLLMVQSAQHFSDSSARSLHNHFRRRDGGRERVENARERACSRPG